MRGRVLSILAIALVMRTGAARGEDNGEKASALFKEGRQLASSGRYPEACAKLEESLRFFKGPGTEFNLADCWEHLGRVASAQAMFLDVAETTHELGQLDRETAARARATALDAKLPHLVLRVAKTAEGLELRVAGVDVAFEDWGTPIAVDPGHRTVEAEAPAKKPWKIDVAIPNEPTTVIVEIPMLQDAPAAKATSNATESEPPPSPTTGTAPAESPSGPERAGSSTTRNVLTAVAGVGAVTAGISWVLYQNKNTRARNVCPSSVGCSQADIDQHQDLVDGARTARTVGFVGLGLTAASLAALALVYVTTPRHTDELKAASPSWRFGASAGFGNFAAFAQKPF